MTSNEPPILDMRTDITTDQIKTIYRELLAKSFGPNELDAEKTLLDGLAKDGSYEAWGLCVLDGETPLGCVLGYPDESSGVLLIGYLVVNPRLRGEGIGSRLIGEVQKRWFNRPEYPLVLSEVEDPRHHAVVMGGDPVKRVALYARQGMQVVVGPYFQPKLEGEGKTRVYNLFLTVVNASDDPTTWQDAVSGEQIANFLCEYFRSSGEGEDWPRDDDETGKELLAFYENNERVPLRPIGEWEHFDIPPLT
jgi:GNAT superfamily N-acetyltransferase